MMHFPRYMMGTKALAKVGDISRDEPDLCLIEREEGDDYIGAWVAGFGFFDVAFPKATTRELTDDEIEHFDKRAVRIGSGPSIPMRVREINSARS